MDGKFRKEMDSLGEVLLPASALFGAQTQRALDNFPISGLRPWRAFIWSIAAVKHAAALVNYETGLFNDREVDGKQFTAKQMVEAVAGAAQEVMDGRWDDSICRGSLPGGRGNESQYECERGDRQSRHTNFGRSAR